MPALQAPSPEFKPQNHQKKSTRARGCQVVWIYVNKKQQSEEIEWRRDYFRQDYEGGTATEGSIRAEP
jgi:transcription initiation factor TFIIIB Brf1 subunit/transcription initiation factor TFIIB